MFQSKYSHKQRCRVVTRATKSTQWYWQPWHIAYQLTERLYEESKLVSITMLVMLERRVVRHQKASTLRMNAKIEAYWKEYIGSTRSAERLLKACAHVHAHSLTVYTGN